MHLCRSVQSVMPMRRQFAEAPPRCLQWSLTTFTVWVLPQTWWSRYIWHCFTAACRSSARTSRDEEAAVAAAARASPSNLSRISPSCAHICRDEEHAAVAAAVRGFKPYQNPTLTRPHLPRREERGGGGRCTRLVRAAGIDAAVSRRAASICVL